MAKVNGTGKGGKSFQDRELAASVRTLALNQIKDVLDGKLFNQDDEFKKAVLLKLAGTVLPRLNEHSGPAGQPIPILATMSDDADNEEREERTDRERE